jgi:molybdopterin molybdotransferase
MLELEEAVARILSVVPAPRPETIPLNQAAGRVLVEAQRARVDLPPFDNSAMDGYAARAEDIAGAAQTRPTRLQLVGRVAAGGSFAGQVSKGNCVRIFTGSPLPKGADCVVMQEDTRIDSDPAAEVLVLEPARPWENVRLKGEDVRCGAELAGPGEPLTAGLLSLLAAAGVEEVSVGRMPVVGIIATGTELKEAGQPLIEGQIYESNRIGLAALIRGAGGRPEIFGLVADDLEATTRALSEAFGQCDIVVTVGGASVGELDLVKPSLGRLGAQLEFWKVAIKPGRPFLFGRFNHKLLFGLPGNPVSALVTFLLLARPALKRWQGASRTQLSRFSGVLAESVANPGPRRHFIRVKLDGKGAVSLSGAQASHLLSSFATAEGLLDVPPQTSLPAGTSVSVQVWEL